MTETDTSKHGQVRELILASVLDAVKQCQRHFGAGQGVATEGDHRVVNLVNSLDSCLSHGFKRKAAKLKHALGRREESGAFWPAVKEVLSDFQFQRLKSVVQSEQSIDFSKANMGVIWLKVSLNERNLQTILTTLLADKNVILKYYDEHAFLRDEEKSSVLPTSAAGLGSVIFALTVCSDARSGTPPKHEDKRYSPTPHYSLIHARDGQASPLLTQTVAITDSHRQMTYKTDPLSQSEKISSFSNPSSALSQPTTFLQGDFTPEPVMSVPKSEIVRRDSKHKKRSQRAVIQFGEDTDRIVERHKQKVDEWSGALTLTKPQDTFQEVSHGDKNGILDSFPEETNHTSDLSDKSSQQSNSDPEEQNGPLRQLVGELSSSPAKTHHTSIYTNLEIPAANQLRVSTQEALDATAIALGASVIGTKPKFEEEDGSCSSQSLSEMSRGDLEALMVAMSKQNARITEKSKQQQIELDHEQMVNGMLRDEIELEKSEMKRREDELSMKVSSISRENELLKGQLKKYVGIVQSIEIKDSMGLPHDIAIHSLPPLQDNTTQDDEKISQLSDMYGELMELNERLHRDLILKNRVIVSMQSRMLSLGLQVPTFQIPHSVEQQGSNHFEGEGVLKREIVKIWIPSAFLKDEAYHVYQIYIRIHSDEWNVYRRYTEFHEFHLQLRKKVPLIGTFYFPPKKNIGRRDAKLVEERRQRLQSYLRYMVHILSNSTTLSKPPLFTDSLNKQKFLQLLPFFADPPAPTSSRSSSPAVYLSGATRRGSAQLQAPPRSPTYKGL